MNEGSFSSTPSPTLAITGLVGNSHSILIDRGSHSKSVGSPALLIQTESLTKSRTIKHHYWFGFDFPICRKGGMVNLK